MTINDTNYLTILNLFPNFITVFEAKFTGWEINYTVDNFNIKLSGFVSDNFIELSKLENLKNKITILTNDLDWGMKANASSTNENIFKHEIISADASNNLYNTDTTNSNFSNEQTTVDKPSEFLKQLQSDYSMMYEQLIKKLMFLFIRFWN